MSVFISVWSDKYWNWPSERIIFMAIDPNNENCSLYMLSSVQLLSCIQLVATPWTAACQASLSITNSQSLLKLMSIELVMPSKHHFPLSSPSPPISNLSQHQGLFQWVSSLHQVAKVLEFQLQHQSFQFSGCFPLVLTGLGLTDLISLQSKGLSRVFSNSTVQKHQFFSAQLSLWSNSHIHTWLLKKTIALTRRAFISKVMSMFFNMLSMLVISFLPSHFIKIFINCYHILIGQQSMTYWNFLRKIKKKGCSFSTI